MVKRRFGGKRSPEKKPAMRVAPAAGDFTGVHGKEAAGGRPSLGGECDSSGFLAGRSYSGDLNAADDLQLHGTPGVAHRRWL